MDFDETRLYYSHQQAQGAEQSDQNDAENRAAINEDDSYVDLSAVRRHFREFLRNYRLGRHRYVYREKLLRMHHRLNSRNNAEASKNANNSKLEVDLAHIREYDVALLGFLLNQPATILAALEKAASDALQTLLYDMQQRRNTTNDDNDMDDEFASSENTQQQQESSEQWVAGLHIQILFKGNLKPTPLRSIKSEHMHHLLKCPGIVISTSPVKNRGIQLKVRCHNCADEQTVFSTDGPFGSVVLPANCPSDIGLPDNHERKKCARYPYAVVPDESTFVDQQTLKLQEAPERVPTGEMPRSVLLAVERSLVDVAPPGTRVSVLCIPTLFTSGKKDASTKLVYLRVVWVD